MTGHRGLEVAPRRGDVWFANLAPIKGHEQAGHRPCLIVSADPFNRSAAALVVVVPITSTIRGRPCEVLIRPPEGGLSRPSVVLGDQVRSIAKQRLATKPAGRVSPATLGEVEDRLRMLLDL